MQLNPAPILKKRDKNLPLAQMRKNLLKNQAKQNRPHQRYGRFCFS
jgi:hypothetical protein